MKYQNISPFYRPIDERKRLTAGQFRFMRVIALIIFVVLLFISFRSDAHSHHRFRGKNAITIVGNNLPFMQNQSHYGVLIPDNSKEEVVEL